MSETALVLRFLQQRIDNMGSQIECQAGGGVKQLKDGVRRDLIIASGSYATDLSGVYPIRSRGNTFTVDLGREKMKVNGISEKGFFILTCLHLFSMALAFFLMYPIILIIWASAVLCRLVGYPLPQAKVDRWLGILHLCFFVPLIAIGLGHGIYGMGDSRQFRTQHGIMGLVTVALALIATVIYFLRRRLVRNLPNRPESAPRIKWLSRADTVICQVILLLSSIVLTNGLDDFSSMSLCATNVVSLSLSVSLGTMVSFIWNAAMAAGIIEWWLKRRIRKRAPTEVPMSSRLLLSESTNSNLHSGNSTD
ncbi:hypothetical protein B0I37DRAFT_377939 [Chaetomium sp. MPI-CAGE-AT-0009]|nr:hypothetical protein B0I37DRAFT_377939 [Chaetomium sp. MPI-CAGE-AT-0009]